MASLVLGYSKKTQWKVQEMKAGHKKGCVMTHPLVKP